MIIISTLSALPPEQNAGIGKRLPGTDLPLPLPVSDLTPMQDSADGAKSTLQTAQVQDTVSHINSFLKQNSSNIEFSIDQDSGSTIVKVVDRDTDTVLRQYPTKELLAIAKDISKFQGLLIKTRA